MQNSSEPVASYSPLSPQQTPTKTIVSTPGISADHIQSAQITPHSPFDDRSSGLLSASITDLRNHSPPPKPETDDYFGSKARLERRTRHQAKHHGRVKEHSNPNEHTQGLLATESKPQSNTQEKLAKTCPTRSSSQSTSLILQPQEPHFSTGPASVARSKTWASNNAFGRSAGGVSSPAAKALRRLSQSKPTLPDLTQRRRQKSNHQLERPASITVRKASSAHHYMNSSYHPISDSSSQIETQINPRQSAHIPPPNVELVAFYSEYRQKMARRHTNAGSIEPHETAGKNRKHSVSQSSDIFFGRRQSQIADLAITFADVHVAPGTFLVDGTSRRKSFADYDFPQRLSAVQFRSRNSVHEIIWREDEMANISSGSCTSQGSSSPDQLTQFQTISTLQPDIDSITGHFPHSTAQKVLTIPFTDPECPMSSGQIQGHVFSSPWGKPADAIDHKANHSIDSSLKSGTGARVNGSSHVSFSAPAGDSEWSPKFNKTPVVDVDCSCGEEEGRASPHENHKIVPRQSIRDLEDDTFSSSRAADIPCGSPRLWEVGKTGSHLGVSSHQSKLVPR